MKSHEAIRQAVDEPGVKSIAAAMKVSSALVYKWCEPPVSANDKDQSGSRNPLDRVLQLYSLTGDQRLIRWLCNAAGGFFVSNPTPEANKTVDEAIFDQTRSMMRDFSRLLDTVTESVEDDRHIDLDEAEAIRQKWENLKACVEQFVLACERGHYHFRQPGAATKPTP